MITKHIYYKKQYIGFIQIRTRLGYLGNYVDYWKTDYSHFLNICVYKYCLSFSLEANILDSILIAIDNFWHYQLNDFPLDFFYPDWLVNFRQSICNYIERDELKD
jgi:hypothetical protein